VWLFGILPLLSLNTCVILCVFLRRINTVSQTVSESLKSVTHGKKNLKGKNIMKFLTHNRQLPNVASSNSIFRYLKVPRSGLLQKNRPTIYLLRRQTHGYLTSRRASPPIDRYRIILLGDRGTRVWTTCPRLYLKMERPRFETAISGVASPTL